MSRSTIGNGRATRRHRAARAADLRHRRKLLRARMLSDKPVIPVAFVALGRRPAADQSHDPAVVLTASGLPASAPTPRPAPFTLAVFALAFVVCSAALVHAPQRSLHPHRVALSQRGVVHQVATPAEIDARDLEMSDARSELAVPVLGDLSVLRTQPQTPHPPIPTVAVQRNGTPSFMAPDLLPGPPVSSSDFGENVETGPPTGSPSRVAIGETELPPLSLAPLEGSITAEERSFEALDHRNRQCTAEGAAQSLPKLDVSPGGLDFGRALAAAALRQTAEFVVYTDRYRRISYPMGDVPAMFGVCTDVIIRAYRALGIDLQALIHAARIGSPDRSIAHRRTFTLRRYFASRGASLPVTTFVEDYVPGDIVTYDRPQNRGSRDHIAIVSDIVAPSGRPMIVHNRGWGPQLEDALFVDRITGHYRYRGQTEPRKSRPRPTAESELSPESGGKARSPQSQWDFERRSDASGLLAKSGRARPVPESRRR